MEAEKPNYTSIFQTFGPVAQWQVWTLVTFYSFMLFTSVFVNSTILCFLKWKLSYNGGWTVINRLIACQSSTGLEMASISIPMYLYMLISGNRMPLLCTVYEWHFFFVYCLTYAMIVVLGYLRYVYVFHYRQLQNLNERTIFIIALVVWIFLAVLSFCVRYLLESPLNKGIRVTICATQYTTPFKDHWALLISPHFTNLTVFFAYARILRRLRSSSISDTVLRIAHRKRVNLVDAKTSAITIFILEIAVLMSQLANVVDPAVIPETCSFFLQEFFFIFFYSSHFVPAVVYSISRQEIRSGLWKIWRQIFRCSNPSVRINVANVYYESCELVPSQQYI